MLKTCILVAGLASGYNAICKPDSENIPVLIHKTDKRWIIKSESHQLFSYLLDKSRDCRLVITYGGIVEENGKTSKLLGTEYLCDDGGYITLESGGKYFSSQISFK